MTNFSHLDALQSRLARETERLLSAKNANEKAFRQAQINSCNKEIAHEYKFLGIEPFVATNLSYEEMLAELGV